MKTTLHSLATQAKNESLPPYLLIKKYRKIGGITQQQLAERTGISVACLNSYESSGSTPSVQNFQILAEALNIPENIKYTPNKNSTNKYK